MAIDDVVALQGGSCEQLYAPTTTTPGPSTTPPPPPEVKFTCDFENDMCEWTSNSNMKWTRQNGRNASFGSAPLTDTTLQSSRGYYAFVANGSLDAAYLNSPNYKYASDSCLEFW